MNQIERVRKMEKIFEDSKSIIYEASENIENNTLTAEIKHKFESIEDDMNSLSTYYNDGSWKEDYDANCDGMFPPCLEKEILDEYVLDDFLTDYEILKEQI